MVESAIGYFAPIALFLLVFIVVFAILSTSKVLGTNKWVQLFVGLLIASLFVSFSGATEYAKTIVPWVAVLILALFFVLLVLGFVGKMEFMNKGVGIAFFIILVIILLVSAFVVFNGTIGPYLPWNDGSDQASGVTNVLYSWRVVGAVILIIISALVAWILTKK